MCLNSSIILVLKSLRWSNKESKITPSIQSSLSNLRRPSAFLDLKRPNISKQKTNTYPTQESRFERFLRTLNQETSAANELRVRSKENHSSSKSKKVNSPNRLNSVLNIRLAKWRPRRKLLHRLLLLNQVHVFRISKTNWRRCGGPILTGELWPK